MTTEKTPQQQLDEKKLALYGPDTPMDKLQNALAGIHIYNCESEGARGDMARDYGLASIPHQAIYAAIEVPGGLSKEETSEFCRKEEERRGHTEENFKEYCKACDEHGEAQMDHELGAVREIANRVIGVLRGSECGYCGNKHSDPRGEYGNTYDQALMSLFERVADEIVARSKVHEHSLFNQCDLVEYVGSLDIAEVPQ
jgi:hypothetical protein